MRAWWTIVVLFLVAALCTMDRLVLNLLVDPVRQDLGISESQMSLLQGVGFSLFYAVAGAPIGVWCDRWSRRNLLLIAVCTWSLATGFSAFAAHFSGFFAARLLVGAGEAALWPVAVSLIGDVLPPERRGRAIGLVVLGQIVGSSLALILGGLVLTAAAQGVFAHTLFAGRAPWRVLMFLWGLLGSVAVALLLTVREPERRASPTGAPALTGFGPFFSYLGGGRGPVLPLFVASFFMAMAVYASAAWTASFYIRHFGFTAAKLGAPLGLVGLIAGVVATFLAGFSADWAERAGRRRAKINIVLVALLCCFPGAMIVFAPTAQVAFAITALSSLAYPVAGAMLIILLQDTVPDQMRGVAMAVNGFCANLLGASIGPVLVALATEHVYGDPKQVGLSILTITLPALMAGGLAILAAREKMSAVRAVAE